MADFGTILGLKIRLIRETNNLNQQEFAETLNMDISKGQISRIETAVNMPSALFIKSVCQTFKVSPAWLLSIDNIEYDKYDDLDIELLNILNKLPDESKQAFKSAFEALVRD